VGKLVFHRPDNGALLHLYLANPDGTGVQQITTGGGLDQGPAWSPDGRHIAFARHRGFNVDIYVLRLNGSTTRLTTGAAADFAPAWSPDGSRLAFVRAIGNPDIYVMNRDGSRQRRLVAGQAPAWSPDGRLIAIGRLSADKVRIFTVRPNGTALTRITPVSVEADEPAWSPDGKRIAFSLINEAGLSSDIAVIDRGGSNLQRITTEHEGQDVSPAWSPDGAKIVFGRITDDGGGAVERLYTVNPDGSGLVNITPDSEGAAPDWQPLCTINGTVGDDTILGTSGLDVICAGSGNDVIRARGSNDVVFGGRGADRIYGEYGGDVLVGGAGADVVAGGPGKDLINTLDRREGNDAARGGDGWDVCLTDQQDRISGCP
jgi:TolB protein